VIGSGDWHLLGALKQARSLRDQKFDIVHIEYPTAGFGTKLGPQGLSLLQNCVVTIHEASQRQVLRQLSLIPFAFRSAHIVFTSEFERRFAVRWIPWISRTSSVIPVGSNIPLGITNQLRTLNEIVHFGLLLPGKGLEQVLELGGLIRSAGLPLVIRILGRVPPRHSTYFERLRSEAAGLPITWDLDLSEQQIANRLAGGSIAYLPYPDGASERRTTLRAALLNGLAVITTHGTHTPQSLESTVKFCRTAQEALEAICSLTNDREEMARMASNATHSELAQSWEHIAQQHQIVYRRVLTEKRILPRVLPNTAQHETHGNTGAEMRDGS
jgi:glycosyltransferase involved in cell wall biosynthesis